MSHALYLLVWRIYRYFIQINIQQAKFFLKISDVCGYETKSVTEQFDLTQILVKVKKFFIFFFKKEKKN